MKQFEYDITTHPAGEFSDLVYVCTDQGDCTLDRVPSHQVGALGAVMNDKGSEGWELVQFVFVKGGVVGFWKREA